MRILYLITKSELGGAQTHVLSLMKCMKEKGSDVALMSYPGGWLEAEAKKIGVEFFPNTNFTNAYNPLNIPKAILKIKRAVKVFKPDIAHCHSSGAGFYTRLAIHGKVPTIFTAHSWAFTEGAPFLRKIIAIFAEKIVSSFTSKIICVSEFDKKLALKYKIASENKLVKIYNAVPEIEFKKNETDKNTFDILSVGRFAYPKRFDLLIKAFKNLPEDVLNKSRLSIVGFGQEQEKLSDLIKELQLEDKISLQKINYEELIKKVSNFDIFILISKHEGLPMTILEAMSAGLPVIASNVGGIPEQINSNSGILVENTTEEITKAILDLYTNQEKKIAMGIFARKKSEKFFSMENFISKTEEVYFQVLSKRVS